jgi:hypothetical protein
MLELKAGAFCEIITRLASTASYIQAKSDANNVGQTFHEETKLEDLDRVFMQGRLFGMPEHLKVLGTRVAALAVVDAEAAIHHPMTTWGNVKVRFDEINNTLKRELSLQTVLVLESKEQEYLSSKESHFGQEIASKFQSLAAFEIDEAAKCLAFGRSTACVFHLMRVMEIGIKAISQCLGIPDPVKPSERNWGKMLEAIKKQGIEQKWPTVASRSTGDGALFEAIYASLDAVKNPWRNSTMHVENKYTSEEAEHIFVAVRGFMKKIAVRMDEQGLLLA